MYTLDARLTALSSSELLAALDCVAAASRELGADLIALLAECDGRRLYVGEGYESLFEFCVRRLRLSESQAYHRIQAARAARSYPLVLERLRAGRVTMTAVALLREHLTESNHRKVLDWAEGRRKREVEVYVRSLAPRPDLASSVRRLAAPAAVAAAADRAVPAETGKEPAGDWGPGPLLTLVSPASAAQEGGRSVTAERPEVAVAAAVAPRPEPVGRAEIRPLSSVSYSLRVTISQETHDKLRRAQDLLRHAGAADPALVLDRALTLLVAHLERKKAGAPRTDPSGASDRGGDADRPAAAGRSRKSKPPRAKPRPSSRPRAMAGPGEAAPAPALARRRSRYIAARVRRAVWERDGACCAFVSQAGVRCGATASLEFHHRLPFAEGGESTVENLEVRCSRHNQAEADRWFNFDQTKFGRRRSGSAGPTPPGPSSPS